MSKFEYAKDKSDPRRCTGPSATGDGRCPFLGMVDPRTNDYTSTCARHGGVSSVLSAAKVDRRLYNVAKWNGRLKRFRQHEEAKTLTSELAVLRLLLEQKLRYYATDSELLMASGSVADLIGKIDRVVRSCVSIDKATGLYIDRQTVENLAEKLVQIVCEYIEDGDILEDICRQFEEAMTNATKPTGQIQGSSNSELAKAGDQDLLSMDDEL